MMGLQDHFHPPLSNRRHWHSFHNAWATYIASDLNAKLPDGYFAEPNVQFGIEIDVAAFEEAATEQLTEELNLEPSPNHSLRPTRSSPSWQPSTPAMTIPFSQTDELVQVNIFNAEQGPTLMAAVELVSPANKDRVVQRDAFVGKCLAYLQQGIGLVMVDVVTVRTVNLHQALMATMLSGLPSSTPTTNSNLYAAAYHPVRQREQFCLEIWQEELAIAQPLPTLPLWLRSRLCLPLDLQATYQRTCQEQRIFVDA
jgi:Protein of unknown function (DUF4058)